MLSAQQLGERVGVRVVPQIPALEQVGELAVSPKSLRHYFVAEAHACASVIAGSVERIIGTSNERQGEDPDIELYGWGGNVTPHIDDFGFIYFMPLLFRLSRVSAAGGVDLHLRRGRVYRLDDRRTHWTRDAGPAVCLYAGIFKQPQDELAIGMMRTGLGLLARGSRQAPRVRRGFRAPAPWECWVADMGGGKDLMPVDLARRRRMLIATCGLCERRAWYLDTLFPYHHELNRCREHFHAETA